jgi:hypothetical protein
MNSRPLKLNLIVIRVVENINTLCSLKLEAFLLVVFLILISLSHPSFASSVNEKKKAAISTPDSDYIRYDSEKNLFSAMVPGTWGKEENNHPYGDLTTVYGVKLIGPKKKDRAPITISLLHYSGKRIFTKYEDYIRNRLNSMVRTDYDNPATITDTIIAGQPGKEFKIKTFELIYLPVRDLPPVKNDGIRYEIAPPSIKVEMIDQFIVIPAGKGFYVLHYRAPEDIADQYQNVFEKVTASFEPHWK